MIQIEQQPKKKRNNKVEQFGNITLYNGNCLDIMKEMISNNQQVDLVCIDPPYKVTSRGNAGNSGGMLQKDINKKGKVFANNDCNVKDWMPLIYQILKDGSHCYKIGRASCRERV